MLQMVIEAAGGRVTEDAAQATARTIVLAGEKDLSGYSTSKAKKPPWSPAHRGAEEGFPENLHPHKLLGPSKVQSFYILSPKS